MPHRLRSRRHPARASTFQSENGVSTPAGARATGVAPPGVRPIPKSSDIIPASLNALLLTFALVLGEFTIAYLLLYNDVLQPELFAINRNTPNAGVIFSTSFAALLFAFVLLLILSYAGRTRRGRG